MAISVNRVREIDPRKRKVRAPQDPSCVDVIEKALDHQLAKQGDQGRSRIRFDLALERAADPGEGGLESGKDREACRQLLGVIYEQDASVDRDHTRSGLWALSWDNQDLLNKRYLDAGWGEDGAAAARRSMLFDTAPGEGGEGGEEPESAGAEKLGKWLDQVHDIKSKHKDPTHYYSERLGNPKFENGIDSLCYEKGMSPQQALDWWKAQ